MAGGGGGTWPEMEFAPSGVGGRNVSQLHVLIVPDNLILYALLPRQEKSQINNASSVSGIGRQANSSAERPSFLPPSQISSPFVFCVSFSRLYLLKIKRMTVKTQAGWEEGAWVSLECHRLQ